MTLVLIGLGRRLRGPVKLVELVNGATVYAQLSELVDDVSLDYSFTD